ncbi:hypothetical protein PAN31117_01086 [Pandoraea anapnoica]|uniref:Inner membrane protein RclC n=1 Tax=Pandoraea anapnoica TaxID=2508301 RepID=A0A5E4ZRN4_9BURK|nr:DUF417 family protein [Pandoraea anapnoica]VVE62933.1 hypothetical protein PAN31117_01086 [Pandoraea anapnoica]
MHNSHVTCRTAARLERFAYQFALYSVVGIFVGYGLFKFTEHEAAAIFPLVNHHPLLGWLYLGLSVQTVSNLVGTFELASALAMAYTGDWRVRLAGSLGVALTLIVTVSFLGTTPDIGGGTFGFLIKDLTLLGVALLVAARTFAQGHKHADHGPCHPALR